MENSGFARYMHHNTDLASQIKAFYMEISKPVIADVDIKYPESDIDPTSVVKLGTSNFYSGGEVSSVYCLSQNVLQLWYINGFFYIHALKVI